MWLYIKVAKNKSGKEIIKDIKFETFGCVAALATRWRVFISRLPEKYDASLALRDFALPT